MRLARRSRVAVSADPVGVRGAEVVVAVSEAAVADEVRAVALALAVAADVTEPYSEQAFFHARFPARTSYGGREAFCEAPKKRMALYAFGL